MNETVVRIGILYPFPTDVNKKIDTLHFIMASESVASFIGQFGILYTPVKNDIIGNIRRLRAKYEENNEEHGCLKEMIRREIAITKQGEKADATEALLWLRRGLNFFCTFLNLINKDLQNNDLRGHLRTAYQCTLEKHHDFFAKMLFNTLCATCPSREKFNELIGVKACLDNNRNIFDQLNAYIFGLMENLAHLSEFHKIHDIAPYQ